MDQAQLKYLNDVLGVGSWLSYGSAEAVQAAPVVVLMTESMTSSSQELLLKMFSSIGLNVPNIVTSMKEIPDKVKFIFPIGEVPQDGSGDPRFVEGSPSLSEILLSSGAEQIQKKKLAWAALQKLKGRLQS